MDREKFESLCSQRVNAFLPACGGTETPFVSRSGIKMLYVYNPATEKHCYINVGNDMPMTDEEAAEAMMMR